MKENIEYEIPYGVTTIDEGAFYSCSNLETIVIPNTVTNIIQGAFCGCTNLRNIEIPSSVASIGDCIFGDCWRLTDVRIPDGITNIPAWTFGYCRDLNKVIIPDSVIYIHETAFIGCNSSLTIYGKSSSYAETYANEKGIEFIPLDENITSDIIRGDFTSASTSFAGEFGFCYSDDYFRGDATE